MLIWPGRWWAASEGHGGTVGELIHLGANANHLDIISGERPIQQAAQKNHGAVVKILLEAGVKPLVLPSSSEKEKAKESSVEINMEPAYRSACEHGHEEAVAAFIPFLDLAAKQQCLAWAACSGRSRVVAQILPQPGIDVDALHRGQTALFKACLIKDLATTKVLLEAGADPKLLNECWEVNYIYIATPIVERPDGSFPQYSYLHAICGTVGPTPDSREHDHEDIYRMAQLVIQAGADLDCHTANGMTALHGAAGVHYYLAQLLIESGASTQVRNSESQTPLHVCQVEACVSLLVESGIDIDARDAYGRTALLVNVGNRGFIDIVLQLLAYGADAGAIDAIGQGALHLALGSYDAEPVSPPISPMLQLFPEDV